MVILFVLIADGWTIQYSEFPSPENVVPLTFTVCIFHLVFAGIGKTLDNTLSNFSELEGISGLLIMLMRLCFLAFLLSRMCGV